MALTTPCELLIEPFGIEIEVLSSKDLLKLCLLIEPFGIEILVGLLQIRMMFVLLIEPFGIEIWE